MKTALDKLDERIHGNVVANRPERKTFKEFLLKDARVPIGGGEYGPFTFKGREALEEIVDLIDFIHSQGLTDCALAIAGGAQFGKSTLELYYLAYATSQRWLNVGLYLPDNDLVQGMVDTKLRPDVIDQVDWLADMVTIGKAVNKSGKAANRKGAFMVTDGRRKANGMVLGLGKVPTSFSFDVTLEDEKDDIPEKNARYIKGRRTASKMRFSMVIGTQRVHGRGMEKKFKDGSQAIVTLDGINPEESFPQIIRCQMGMEPSVDDPKLTWAGDFRHDTNPGVTVTTHNPDQIYYFANPTTGEFLDRYKPVWLHRRPEKIKEREWSFRLAQLDIPAIGLSQIVGQFQLAVANPDEMIVFRCDVLGLPQSTTQALSPSIIKRAQDVEPYDMRLNLMPDRSGYAGLDMGDRCWFYTRERESEQKKRAIYVAQIPLGDVVQRAVGLFHQMKLGCMGIDQRPDAAPSRDIALELNGLAHLTNWPKVPKGKEDFLSFESGLRWNAELGKWQGLKCFVVRFDKNQVGSGIEHGFDVFEQGGHTKFVPLIRCNRQDAIDRVVREFLTPSEGVTEYYAGRPRELPAMLLPMTGTNKIVERLAEQLVLGSEREKLDDGTKGDYLKACENHFLLADAYSALAESEGLHGIVAPFKYRSVNVTRGQVRDKHLGKRRVA
jgi:hypothetical protein